MTQRAQNADFRRKPQIFADSPLLLEIQAFGGCRKPQILAENRRFSQKTAGNCRLGSVTLGASPLARPYYSYNWPLYYRAYSAIASRGQLELRKPALEPPRAFSFWLVLPRIRGVIARCLAAPEKDKAIHFRYAYTTPLARLDV